MAGVTGRLCTDSNEGTREGLVDGPGTRGGGGGSCGECRPTGGGGNR